MFKQFSICAVVTALGMGSLNAQQQEAVLQKVEIPNTNFSLVLAMAKPGGWTIDLRSQPEAYVAFLMEGELVHPFNDDLNALNGVSVWHRPACTFNVAGKGPVGVYVAPKHAAPRTSATR